jgi:hypothetical protein
MTIKIKHLLFSALLGGTVFTACEKNQLNLSDNLDTSGGGYFKLGWFSPGLNTQGVQLKINGVRMSNQLGYGTGFTSTTTYAMPFPGGGLNTGGNNKNDYLSVDTGNIEVMLSVPKKGTNTDSITVITTTMKIEKGKYYSLIVCDSFPNATSYTLDDNVNYADSGFYRLNFTNTIPNVGAGVDFTLSNSNSGFKVLASDVQYKAATGFKDFPYTGGSDTFRIRKTGTTAILATYTTSSVTNKRCFTVAARGYISAAGVRAPAISLIFNK